jgi:hypothetical protein
MKSPSEEAVAQLMFWGGMICLPLAIILTVVGTFCRKATFAALAFVCAGVAFTHFLWFFNVLGGSLGTKVGKYVPPSWYSFVPYGLLPAAGLLLFWFLFKRLKENTNSKPK